MTIEYSALAKGPHSYYSDVALPTRITCSHFRQVSIKLTLAIIQENKRVGNRLSPLQNHYKLCTSHFTLSSSVCVCVLRLTVRRVSKSFAGARDWGLNSMRVQLSFFKKKVRFHYSLIERRQNNGTFGETHITEQQCRRADWPQWENVDKNTYLLWRSHAMSSLTYWQIACLDPLYLT